MSAGQRVFLVDGQAVYLEGDGDITEDVLQQALAQLAAGGGQAMEQAEPEAEAESVEPELKQEDEAMDSQEGIVLNTDDAGDEEGVLAILQDETGQQQTVRLTPDQAAALGIDYQQLLAAASATGADDESDAAAGEAAAAEPAAADPVPAEQTSAQEVASLATSVVLDLNESQPSLVNQSDGGDKVTYTFEVVDKDAAAGSGQQQQPQQLQETGLLTKSRDIMVPRVRTGDTRQLQQQIHRTAAQVLRTDTPSAPIPRDPVTGGYISSATLKKGPVYNTGPNSLQNKRRTVINTANTVQQKLAQTSAAPSMPSVSATTISGDPMAVDMDDDVDDLPVILTPVSGSEQLPDFIEPRPGMKILVRPLEMAAGASGDGPGSGAAAAPSRAVGSSENPIQLVQQGNTFKSLQPLSSEQLKQIATVLQQSRLNVPSNSKNSLYDADTNTRIVYRVVYPEDVGRGGRGRGRRGRPRGRGYQSRRADDGDVDWSPELSRYEKAERKRLATKTRTGRVSKPPKHMVKDYRRIHRLDFDEPDLDDSDGGYSEWDETTGGGDLTRDSTELSNDASAAGDSSTTAPGGAGPAAERLEPEPPQELAPRPKRPMAQALRDRFTCRTCNALCIGYMRLEAHFAKYPDHERPVYVPPKTAAMRRPYGRPGGYRSGLGRGRGRGRGRGAYVPVQPVAKRPRLDGESSDSPPLSVDDVLAQLMALSGGSVERLCESMSAVLEEFRYHVRSAVTPTPAAERPVITATARAADGPVLKVDEERSSLTGLPAGTYVLWPIAPSTDDTGESVLGDAADVSSVSPAPSQPAATATASPSAATALGEAVLAAVSEEGSPTPATAPAEQNTPDTVTKHEEESAPATAAEESPKSDPPASDPPAPAKEATPPPSLPAPTVEAKPEPPPPPAEKDVLSAAEISQVALSAAEGTEMPPAAEVAPPPAPFPSVGGSETELAAEPPPAPLPTTNGRPLPGGHRGVSDVLDEFVDGLVDAPDYALISGESVSDIDSAQIQLKLADSDATASTGGMPLLEDGR